jgi:hypothetical protein
MTNRTLIDQCVQEVIDLHAFFQAWLRGELADRAEVFSRFIDAVAPEFTLISPTGQAARLPETAEWIRRAHGARPGVKLWTDEHTAHFAADGAALLTYREWQTWNGATTLRISSALLRRAPAAPNGVAWLHIHETWIQG